MIDEQRWNRLHDATLLHISITWSTGTVRCELRTASTPLFIQAEGLMQLRIPYAAPWGASISINHIRLRALLTQGYELAIEMQSGDTIIIEANHFVLEAYDSTR